MNEALLKDNDQLNQSFKNFMDPEAILSDHALKKP